MQFHSLEHQRLVALESRAGVRQCLGVAFQRGRAEFLQARRCREGRVRGAQHVPGCLWRLWRRTGVHASRFSQQPARSEGVERCVSCVEGDCERVVSVANVVRRTAGVFTPRTRPAGPHRPFSDPSHTFGPLRAPHRSRPNPRPA